MLKTIHHTLIVLFLFLGVNCSSQNFYSGLGFGRNFMVVHDDESKNYFDFNSYTAFGEYQAKNITIGLTLKFTSLPIFINNRTIINSYYSNGANPGQYTSSSTSKTLKYECSMFSVYPTINLKFTTAIKKSVVFIFGIDMGYSFALYQKIKKDSLITTNSYTNSNPPFSYSSSTNYTYENSSSANLNINKGNLFISPILAIRYNFLKQKFFGELKGGSEIHFTPIFEYRIHDEYKERKIYSANIWFFHLTIGYKLKYSRIGKEKI